jgi:hypothetical protein
VSRQIGLDGDLYVVLTIGCSSPSPLQRDLPSVTEMGRRGAGTLTFTMYPKKTTCQIPVLESAASGEPYGRFSGVDSACNDVIFRRVWRRDPDSGILL